MKKKNNAWNIRRLVDESFIPSTHRLSVIEDCRNSTFGPLPTVFAKTNLDIMGRIFCYPFLCC